METISNAIQTFVTLNQRIHKLTKMMMMRVKWNLMTYIIKSRVFGVQKQHKCTPKIILEAITN